MNKITKGKIASSFFILKSSQSAVNGYVESLSFLARQAYFSRNYDMQTELGQKIAEFDESRGLYFKALASTRQGKGGTEKEHRVLASLFTKADIILKPLILLSLSSLASIADDKKQALALMMEATKMSHNSIYTFTQAQKSLAIFLSLDGNHTDALRTLERIEPLARRIGAAYPAYYLDFQNSLACELGESGQVSRAENLITKVLKSPYARMYPEWEETRKEIQNLAASKPQMSVPLQSTKLTESKSMKKVERSSICVYLEDDEGRMDLDRIDVAGGVFIHYRAFRFVKAGIQFISACAEEKDLPVHIEHHPVGGGNYVVTFVIDSTRLIDVYNICENARKLYEV